MKITTGRRHPIISGKVMQHLMAVLVLEIVAVAVGSRAVATSYQSTRPMGKPVIFGEGVISTGDYESHPAFTPDGQTLYFVRARRRLVIGPSSFHDSLMAAGRRPKSDLFQVNFSGQYSDADPFITADGKKLYFISNRPAPGKATRGLNIWVMDKTENGWNEPHNLKGPVNGHANEWYPTLASDGTLYFGSDRAGGKGATDLYRSQFAGGAYREPENLGSAINTEFDEYEPLIARDQSYLIFMLPDVRTGMHVAGIYFLAIVKKEPGPKLSTWETKSILLETSIHRRYPLMANISSFARYSWPKTTRKTNELRGTHGLAARISQWPGRHLSNGFQRFEYLSITHLSYRRHLGA